MTDERPRRAAMHSEPRRMTDLELRSRTQALVEAAERVAAELQQQNRALTAAIAAFERDILSPLREGKPPPAGGY